MAYSNIDDLKELLPESILVEISNDQVAADEIDMNAIEAAIRKADSMINGYVGVQKQVPLDPVPGMIKTISANLAVYNLYRRRNMVPEIWQDQYKADTAVLLKISSGQISIGVAATERKKESPAQALTHSSPKKMGGSGGLLNNY